MPPFWRVPVATMGFSPPGTAFSMVTGGWVTGAANHLKLMRELKEEGRMLPGNFDFPEKYELIDRPSHMPEPCTLTAGRTGFYLA
ncbi:MAG: hypothetical protein P8Y48_02130 [Novosphingobium sp.]